MSAVFFLDDNDCSLLYLFLASGWVETMLLYHNNNIIIFSLCSFRNQLKRKLSRDYFFFCILPVARMAFSSSFISLISSSCSWEISFSIFVSSICSMMRMLSSSLTFSFVPVRIIRIISVSQANITRVGSHDIPPDTRNCLFIIT